MTALEKARECSRRVACRARGARRRSESGTPAPSARPLRSNRCVSVCVKRCVSECVEDVTMVLQIVSWYKFFARRIDGLTKTSKLQLETRPTITTIALRRGRVQTEPFLKSEPIFTTQNETFEFKVGIKNTISLLRYVPRFILYLRSAFGQQMGQNRS